MKTLVSAAMTERAQGPRRVYASVASGDYVPALVTVPNIEVLEVGEDWETSTGLFTWTEEDLLSAISSQDDPAVRTPVVKLGHVDPRFDGQPAFGRMANLRLSANQQTLIADLIGVPIWLAHIMPSAYPRRSIEGWFAKATRTGNKWPFILTAIALLGDAYPAIVTLDDLKAMWGGTPPPLYSAEDIEEMEDAFVAASRPDGLVVARKVVDVPNWLFKHGAPREVNAAAGGQVQATTSITDVTHAYYDSLEGPQAWWWIRAVLVNPFQLVVDDDEGGLYLVDVNVDASDNITFSDPKSVKVEYVAAVNSNLAGIPEHGQIVAASHGDRVTAGARPKETEGEQPTNTEGEHDIVLTDDALRALGLEPGATPEQINAAILARAQGDGNGGGDGGEQTTAPSTTTAPGGGEPDTTGQPATPATQPEAQPTTAPTTPGTTEGDGGTTEGQTTTPAAAPQVPDGMVLVDSAQWAAVQEGVAAAHRLDQEARNRDRDTFLENCVKAGKFPRARIEHYKGLWALDPQGTKAAIAALADGLIPVTERGTQGEADTTTVEAAYPDSWKRDPHVVRARNSVSTRLKVVND